MIADTPARRVLSRRSERIFYVGMSIAVLAIAFAGFAKSWFLRPYFENPQPLVTTVRIHGAAFTAWVFLLLAQTTLVAAHRTDIHRKLGWIGAALAVFMVGIAIKAAIYAVHRDVLCCDAELARGFFIVPVADAIVFAGLVGTAVWYRRDTVTHKRLMLLATFAILDAATARWPLQIMRTSPYAYLVVLDAMMLAAVAYDSVVRRNLARAWAWGVPLVIASHVLREMIKFTPAWRSFARIFVG